MILQNKRTKMGLYRSLEYQKSGPGAGPFLPQGYNLNNSIDTYNEVSNLLAFQVRSSKWIFKMVARVAILDFRSHWF